jgi:hypothetical protein
VFTQDGLTVAVPGSRAFINELGTVAMAEGAAARVSIVEPMLGATPGDAGGAHRDLAHLELVVTETPRLHLVLTIYDEAQYYDKPLNGTGEGDCGLALDDVSGGSLSAGCTDGPLTATVRVSGAEVGFDVVPFLAGKMESQVKVGVVAGGEELAYHLGFFAFDTSRCFQETCSGQGICEAQGEQATCVCNPGFAPVGLACECVPQCDGRSCGPDGCGDQCAPGCGGGELCSDQGQCVPDGSDPDTGMSGTTGDGGTSGGMDSTSDASTGETGGTGTTGSTGM